MAEIMFATVTTDQKEGKRLTRSLFKQILYKDYPDVLMTKISNGLKKTASKSF